MAQDGEGLRPQLGRGKFRQQMILEDAAGQSCGIELGFLAGFAAGCGDEVRKAGMENIGQLVAVCSCEPQFQ